MTNLTGFLLQRYAVAFISKARPWRVQENIEGIY